MSRREVAKAETRRLILDAARELFWEIGVDGCTMRKIGARAGVAPASVVVHFKNKACLLEAVLGEAIEKRLSKTLASMPENTDLRGRLLHVARAFFLLYATNKDLYRALIQHTCFVPDDASPHLAGLNTRFLAYISAEVAREQSGGSVRGEADTQMVAAALFSLYLGNLIHFLRTPELEPEAAVGLLNVMAGDYLHGVLTTGVTS